MYRLINEKTGEIFTCNWQYDDIETPVVGNNLEDIQHIQKYYAEYGIILKIQKAVWQDM